MPSAGKRATGARREKICNRCTPKAANREPVSSAENTLDFFLGTDS